MYFLRCRLGMVFMSDYTMLLHRCRGSKVDPQDRWSVVISICSGQLGWKVVMTPELVQVIPVYLLLKSISIKQPFCWRLFGR